MKIKKIFKLVFVCIVAVGVVGCSSGNAKDTKEEEKPKEKEFYALHEAVELDDRIFTVTQVSTSAGQDFVKPKEGNEFVIVTVSIKNTGKDEVSYNPLYFKIQNSKGQIENVGFTMFSLDDALSSGDLAKDGEIRGSFAVEQPIGDSDLTLIYQTEPIGGKEIKVKLQ